MIDPKDEEPTSEIHSSEPVIPHVEPVIEVAPTPDQVKEPVPVAKKSSRREYKRKTEPATTQDKDSTTKVKKKSSKVLVLLLALILAFGGAYLVKHQRNANGLAKIQGKVALSAQELRDVVVAKKLTVYWAGPQDGAKYTLIATTPGVAFVRYLPGGVGLKDTKTLFRAIGTYTQKNAFAVSTAGAAALGNVGFVNADGNAVFYSKTRPTNVYVGIKGKDIQIEVFDPVVDQALGLVLVRGQVRQIS